MAITWDAEVPGLGKRKNKTEEIWILKYRIQDRQLMVSLGPTIQIDVVSARALARKMKWEGKKGIGPTRKPRVKTINMQDFCAEYMTRHAKKLKKSWKKDQQRIDEYILPELAKKNIRFITSDDISRLHDKVTARPAPVAANRTLEQLRCMFNLAITWKYLPKEHDNPASGIVRNPEAKRTRWLTSQEMARLAPVLDDLPVVPRVFYWLLIITGLRYSELLMLTWDDIELCPGGRITIKDTKNNTSHDVPLPIAALDLLLLLPKSSPWVFPSPNGPGPFSRIDKTWQRIRGKIGLDDVTIHCFRHTTAAHLAIKGYSIKIIAELLNHKTLSTTMRYTHVGKDHIRAALEDHAGSVLVQNPTADVQVNP